VPLYSLYAPDIPFPALHLFVIKIKCCAHRLKWHKIGEHLFVESYPFDPGDKVNGFYWARHVNPKHILSRVDVDGDTLTFRLMDSEWYADTITKKTLNLKYLMLDGEQLLLKASPTEWGAFLKTHGSDPKLFSDNQYYLFKLQRWKEPHAPSK